MNESASTAVGPPSDEAVRTFLIADVRGYTSFTLTHGDEAAARLAARFAEICAETVSARGGRVVELRGDEALAVFASPRQAIRSAIDLQARFSAESSRGDTEFRVGVGLDAGEAIAVGDGFRGMALNLAARLCSLAGPGEVLVSEALTHLARKVDGLTYVDRGKSQLKGFADPVTVFRVEREQRLAPVAHHESDPSEAVTLSPQLPIGGFLGSLPSGVLVARDDELQRVLTALASASRGEGRTVLLAGEPGAGKTRLAQEATLQARNANFCIAAGRCYEAESGTPYLPFLEVLSAVYAQAPVGLRRDAAARWPYLGALLPDEIGISDVAVSPDAQLRVFRAVTAFLTAVADGIPLAIFLDDLHWADSATLRLLLHLARHTRSSRVLIVGTYRDVEVGRQHPLEDVLREMAREALVDRIPIRRLGLDGTSQLMAVVMGEEEITEEFAALIYERTEGNPFFVQQVMHDLVERGDIFREEGRWGRKSIDAIQVPESVRSVIGQRLSRLDDESQDLLREASVLGQSFLFDELLSMGDRGEEVVERVLEASTRLGLLREMGGDRYAFDHALTQSALYSELSARRRRRLHLTAGTALESLPETKRRRRVSELAWHFLRADAEQKALHYAVLAGDEAAAGYAHAEAEMQYRTALELAREGEREAEEAALLSKLGVLLRHTGRYDEALLTLQRAVDYYRRTGDRVLEVIAVAEMGRVHQFRGSLQEGYEMLRGAAHGLAVGTDARAEAMIWSTLASLSFIKGEYQESADAAEHAATRAREGGDNSLLVVAETQWATSLSKLGGAPEALRKLDAILPLARHIGEPERLIQLLLNLGFMHFLAGDFDRSLPLRREALEVARKVGDPNRIVFACAMMTEELFASGEWDEALEYGREALQVARQPETPSATLYAYHWMSMTHAYRGEWDQARRLGEEGRRLAFAVGDLQGIKAAVWTEAIFHVLSGETTQLRPLLEPYVLNASTDDSPWLLYPLILAYLETGDVAAAERLVDDAMRVLEAQNDRWDQVDVLTAKAMILARKGHLTAATATFSRSVELAATIRCPLNEATALLQWGLVEYASGDRIGGTGHLRAALAIFQRLGAVPLIERAEAALAQAGSAS